MLLHIPVPGMVKKGVVLPLKVLRITGESSKHTLTIHHNK